MSAVLDKMTDTNLARLVLQVRRIQARVQSTQEAVKRLVVQDHINAREAGGTPPHPNLFHKQIEKECKQIALDMAVVTSNTEGMNKVLEGKAERGRQNQM